MVTATKLDVKFPCPICRDGEGSAKFTELSLERHLAQFHKRVDASELTDRWVSDKLHTAFVREQAIEDREIAENMRSYWNHLSCAAER